MSPPLPPGFERKKKRKAVEIPIDESEISKSLLAVGPQLPPAKAAKTSQSLEGEETAVAKRVASVARPNPDDSEKNQTQEEDEDDIYGPQIPMSVLSKEHLDWLQEKERREKLLAIEKRMNGSAKEASTFKNGNGADAGPLVRGEWMLVPPSAAMRAPNPAAKLKSRQFSQKASGDEIIDQSIWTSTPETKASAELEAAKKLLKHNEAVNRESLKERRAKEIHAAINAETRPKSLMEMYSQDNMTISDLSQKRFDRERDIVGRQMDGGKREQLVKDAKALDSKFAPSKFL